MVVVEAQGLRGGGPPGGGGGSCGGGELLLLLLLLLLRLIGLHHKQPQIHVCFLNIIKQTVEKIRSHEY